MNRFALTAAAILTAAAFPAVAADVNVYGRIDTGFMYTINHNQTSDSFEMTSGKSSGSRWGLKGSEQLNEDWQVRFVLESGFDSDAGSFTTTSGDRLFGRQATLSVYNKSFGELALGRSGKPLSGSDQFTRISRFTPFGVTYGDAGLLFYGKGGRVDNGIFYKSPTFAGFTVVLAGSLNTKKDEAADWADNERFLGGSVDYKLGNWGVMVGAEQTVINMEQKGVLKPTGELTVEYGIVNYIIYKEIVVTATRTITMPVDLSFVMFPNEIDITVTSTAVVQNGDEFVRNMDLAADFMVYIAEKYELEETFDAVKELCGKFGDILGL